MLRGIAKTRPRPPLVRSAPLVRVALGAEVIDALWSAAESISEGALRAEEPPAAAGAPPPAPVYFGSTMITLPLERLAAALGLATLEPEALRVVVDLLGGSPLLRARIARLARREAHSRLPGASLRRALTETRLRVAGDQLQIDVDIEVEVEVDRLAAGGGRRRGRRS